MKISAHYDAKKNVTSIEKKLKENELGNEDKDEVKEILSGLVIIKLTTENGKVGIVY